MVFRFSTPLVISVAEHLFLGRQLPTLQSWFCLLLLLVGGIGYTMCDSSFHIKAYLFCLIWYFIFCADQLYLKHITNTVAMSSWGRVFYTNFLACPPLVLLGGGSGELASIVDMTLVGAMALAVSVLLGTAMSYFAWQARSLISATSFTIVGNSCKIL